MGYLTDLKDKIEELRLNIPEIKKFVFDDLSAVNSDSQAEYQLLLLKPPTQDNDNSLLEYGVCDVDMFVFAPELSDEVQDWTRQYDECHSSMVKLLRALFACQPNYVLVGGTKITPGHMQHNAKLIGARAQFKLRVYNGC